MVASYDTFIKSIKPYFYHMLFTMFTFISASGSFLTLIILPPLNLIPFQGTRRTALSYNSIFNKEVEQTKTSQK